MIAETAITTAAGYATSLGLEAGKNWFKDRLDEGKLQKVLTEYILSQKKFNDVASIAEEIDFQGLVNYINKNLLSDVENRFFATNPKVRGQANETIISAAVAYSKAETPESKARVAKLTSNCLDIIREFYRRGISKKEYLLAAEIVDAVTENVVEHVAEPINNRIDGLRDGLEEIKAMLSSGALYSLEQFEKDAQSGDFKSVDNKLKTIFHNIDRFHPLFPYYGFAYEKGLKSISLTPDAEIKYPPKYKFTGRVRAGEKYIDDPSVDLFDYSYRHQLVLTMDVSEVKKYLGDIEDPVGSMITKGELRAYPPEFPPPFPCEIRVGDEIFFDDILMRTQKIEDDGTYVFGNNEQVESPFKFEIKVSFNYEAFKLDETQTPVVVANKTDFKVHIKDASNPEYLHFVKFMKALSETQDLKILVKEAGEFIVAGKINDVNYPAGFESVDQEIDFLERICDIEKYFDIGIKLHGLLDEETYDAVFQISELVRNEEVSYTWTEVSFSGTIDESFRNNIIEMGESLSGIAYVGTMHADLFGTEFEFQHMRKFMNARIKDYERVKSIVELLKDGDPIRVVMIPGEDDTVTETLRIPERMEVAP